MRKIVIIGGGASGLFAAYSASKNKNNKVILLEKNEKLGKKIYITGKGRCNLTTSVPVNEFFDGVVSNPKFLFSAIKTFSSSDVFEFFESNGLKLKIERGNRVFPDSDKASDVTKILEKVLRMQNVEIRLNCRVIDVICDNCNIRSVVTETDTIDCDSAIICTGGLSYPLTGSTGDGLYFAKKLKHNIVEPKPALVGIVLKGADFLSLQGVSLKNVAISVINNDNKKAVYSNFGEMLFTHYGVSGPIVLTCSSYINRKDLSNLSLCIDLKPALSTEILDNRLVREFKVNNTKNLMTVMRSLLPKSLIDIVLQQASVQKNKNCSEITVKERERINYALKNLLFSIKKMRPIEEAIVSAGGVSVKDINPKTMESKIVKGLFFAGEVIDVDAITGGYNLQIAFSSGFVAGANC